MCIGFLALLSASLAACSGDASMLSPTPAPAPSATATAARTRAPTPAPTDTPAPTPTPSPPPAASKTPTSAPLSPTRTATPGVWTRRESVTIPTYPFAAFLHSEPHPLYGEPLVVFDRAAYEASSPLPEPKTYEALVVENAFIRLTFLPELGGRLYQCTWKPTNQALFYNNVVLKPSYWGPLPREENWWLAAGGLEWALPVQEHGYEWGMPWSATLVRQSDRITVILRNTEDANRLQAEVSVTLAAGEGRFTVQMLLKNPTDRPLPVQFWANAMLAPGGSTVGSDLRFVFPAQSVTIHSTGDPALPPGGSTISWPLVGGRDMSRYAEWRKSLGVFGAEPLPSFAGAYNPAADVGVARVLVGVGGVKLFAFGSEFPYAATYTDDGSAYVELWAGANRTFWPEDDRILQPGGSLAWREVWMPIAGTGGFTDATEEAVLRLEREDETLLLAAASPVQRKAVLRLSAGDVALLSRSITLEPGRPYRETVPADASGKPLHLQLFAEDGILLAQATLP